MYCFGSLTVFIIILIINANIMSNTQVPDDTMAFERILTSMGISKWIVFTDVVIRDHMG